MANRTSQTYDDITRSTVLDPDGSVRPTRDQERRAFEGFRAMDDDEQALHDRVRDVLSQNGVDLERVSIEVTRDQVAVRGQVTTEDELRRIPDLIGSIEGVASIDDQLVVAPPGAAD